MPNEDSAVDARVRSGLDLVRAIARSLHKQLGTQVTFDDLLGAGNEGLLQAARGFDEARGVPFRAFAGLRIRGAMIDGLRKQASLSRRAYERLRAIEAADTAQNSLQEEDAGRAVREPSEADVRLTDYLSQMATAMAVRYTADGEGIVEPIDPDMTPEEQVVRENLLVTVRRALASLPDAERTLVEGHYFAGKTLEEAARSIGLSKSWGSRLHARAMASLTQALRGQDEG
jgi:RNA polymerase sigma factor for flagellar operon FliA